MWSIIGRASSIRSVLSRVMVLCALATVATVPQVRAFDSSAAPSGRDAAYWPFDSRSPWNSPIRSDAVYTPIAMRRWSVSGGGYANIEGYSIPTYLASSTDPIRKIYRTHYWTGTGWADAPFPGVLWKQIRVPDAARAAWGTDGHLNVISEDRATVYELFRARRTAEGDLSTYMATSNDMRGPGHHTPTAGTVAAGTSSLGGMIRLGELVNGTGELGTGIRHALQGGGYGKAYNRNAPGGNSWVWPASLSDPPSTYDVTGNVYMGSLLAIPPWVDINALGIADPQALEVARALQDYGVYLIDAIGAPANKIVIRIDPQAADDIRNRPTFDAGLSIALRHLWLVANSHSNGGAPPTPGGGGKPRRPLAPPFGTINSGFPGDTLAFHAQGEQLPSGAEFAPFLALTVLIPLRRSVRRHKGR